MNRNKRLWGLLVAFCMCFMLDGNAHAHVTPNPESDPLQSVLLSHGTELIQYMQSTTDKSQELQYLRGNLISPHIAELLDRYKGVGVSIAFIENGQVSYLYGGKSNLATNADVSQTTMFEVASCTKPVAAWGLMKYFYSNINIGADVLGKPVNDLIEHSYSEVQIIDHSYRPHQGWTLPGSNTEEATLRRVLNHRAGISNGAYLGWEYFGPNTVVWADNLWHDYYVWPNPHKAKTLEGYTFVVPLSFASETTKNKAADTRPPSEWRWYDELELENIHNINIPERLQYKFYSNSNYSIIQRIIEDQSGREFKHFMQEWVIASLGMNNSTFTELNNNNIAKAYQVNANYERVPITRNRIYDNYAHAGLYSTAEDMAKVVLDITTGYEYTLIHPNDPKKCFYEIPFLEKWNYGVVIDGSGQFKNFSICNEDKSGESEYRINGMKCNSNDDLYQYKFYYHSGKHPGWSSYLYFDPDSKDGIVVLTNASGGTLGVSWDGCEYVGAEIANAWLTMKILQKVDSF
jgi:CubicO group peptidase (beta-lactamase class C family)